MASCGADTSPGIRQAKHEDGGMGPVDYKLIVSVVEIYAIYATA